MSLAGAGRSPQTLAVRHPADRRPRTPQKQAERLAPCRSQSCRKAQSAPSRVKGRCPLRVQGEPAHPCRKAPRRQAKSEPSKASRTACTLPPRGGYTPTGAPERYPRTIQSTNHTIPGRRPTDIKKRRHLCSLLHKSRRLMSNPESRRRDFHCVDFDRSLFCGTGLLPYFH